MKNRNVNIGLPSLLLIFTVLCLVTFAALSCVSAIRDYSLSQKTAERTRLYYEADLKLRQQLANLDVRLSEIWEQLPDGDEPSFISACEREYPSLADGLLILEEPFGESQVLQARLSLSLPQKAEDTFYRITGWRTVTTQSWEPDDSLPVLQSPEIQ